MRGAGEVLFSSRLFSRVSLSDYILISLLRSRRVMKEFVVSDYTIQLCFKEFAHLGTSVQISEALETLARHDDIAFLEDYVVLGRATDEECELFVNRQPLIVLTAEFEKLRNKYRLYYSYAKKSGKGSYAMTCGDALKELSEKPADKYVVGDLVKLYSRVYEVIFQMPVPKFQQKEIGMFGHLIKRFGAGTVAKMIFYYLNHSTKYRKETSFSIFYYCKDAVYVDSEGKHVVTVDTKTDRV